jgi:hypothetical protein
MKTKWETRALRRLRQLVSFDTACFGRIGPTPKEGQLPQTEKEVTDFIRQRTSLYREAWILPLIDALIDGDRRLAEKLMPRER